MNRKIFIIILSAFSLLACSFIIIKSSDKNYTKTELYFGFSKTDGSSVTKEEWNAFADSVISRVFSNGSTVIESHGQWRENENLISEESRIVISINEMTPELENKIDEIREKYKNYFHQSSVLKVEQPVQANF